MIKHITLLSITFVTFFSTISKVELTKAEPLKVYIIIGSIRPTQTGEKIAKNIKTMIDKRSEVAAEIVDIASYKLPFYTDPVSPADRTSEITEPALKKWSKKIKEGQAFIIVSPEYNAGYPASLKNALDSLYKEWNNKPVALVGYSGGGSGGSTMLAQLRQVVRLEMIPVATDIKIGKSWKALNDQGKLVNASAIEKDINTIVDQLLKAQAGSK